jgi:hypothetical protein
MENLPALSDNYRRGDYIGNRKFGEMVTILGALRNGPPMLRLGVEPRS